MAHRAPGTPADILARALSAAFPEAPPARLGLAVSGGGDSMALMHLAAGWAAPRGVVLEAATVDHGLRVEAEQEAALVARAAAAHGIPHRTLAWTGARKGNLQAAARAARYRLLAAWARDRALGAVLLAHTRDDQAETVLLRLMRGGGLDGLSAMAARRKVGGVDFLRPLLGVPRATLREALAAGGVTWVEDPSNADPRFDRVRARQALVTLAPLGLDAAALSGTAARLDEARAALAFALRHMAAPHLEVLEGDPVFPVAVLANWPADLRHRLLSHLLRQRAGAGYPPRQRPLRALADAVLSGRGGTLHGCRVLVRRGVLRVTREYAAVAGLTAAPGHIWDGFWQLLPPEGRAPSDIGALHVAALGDAAIPPAAQGAPPRPPRAVLAASPALWSGETLIAAPVAGWGNGWRAVPRLSASSCLDALLSR